MNMNDNKKKKFGGVRLIVSHDEMPLIVHLKNQTQRIPALEYQMPVHIDRRGDHSLLDVLRHFIDGAGHRPLRQS